MGQAIFHVGVGGGLEGVGEGRERERAVFAFEGGLQNQDRKSTRLNSSHITRSRMPSSA